MREHETETYSSYHEDSCPECGKELFVDPPLKHIHKGTKQLARCYDCETIYVAHLVMYTSWKPHDPAKDDMSDIEEVPFGIQVVLR